jgi:DNA polymerase-3 subunit gamma/tau
MCAQVLLPGASTSEKALLTRLERMERRLEGMPAEGPVHTASQQAAPPPRPAAAQEQPPAAGQRAASGGRPVPEDRPAPSGDHPAGPAERPASRERPDGREHPAAGDAPAAEPAAGSVMPAHKAAPGRGGAIDADTLRQRWPDILDAVRQERKVAWMLLRPASVDSLEGSVLTIAFPREGEAKGFTTSGHDQVLTEVLSTMLGLNVRVRGVVGSDPRGPGRSAPAQGAARSGGGTARDVDAPRDSGSGPASAAGAPGSPTGSGGSTRPSGSTGPAGAADRATAPAQADPPEPGAGDPGSKVSSRRGAADPGPAAPEEWPDDAGPAGDAPAVTGMELIERQLGGRVIEEIEES